MMATLDAQKAFDVVHHTILLDRLAESGIPHDIWHIIKDLYSDISSKVKWLGTGQLVPKSTRIPCSLNTGVY